MKTIFTSVGSLLLITVCLFLSGCKKANLTSPKTSSTSSYYLGGQLEDETINITGNPGSYTNSVTVNANTVYGQNDGDNNIRTGYITGMNWVSNNPAGIAVVHGSIELRKLSVRVYVAPIASLNLPAYFYDMVAPSSYPFAYASDPNNGAYITLLDKNNVLWTSEGNQDGSTFQILSRGSNTGNNTTITGTVSCKMYDGNGNVKTFNSGAFSLMPGL